MREKVFVELIVPEIGESFSVFLPINKKIGNIIELLNKALIDITNQEYSISNFKSLYNRYNGIRYSVDTAIKNTDIRDGSVLVLL
ncbi:MAG: hypothetical protein HFI08_02660 [Bacilli bacterium]|nr:hypothetical protein [Bacilli bacterium]